MLKVLSVDEDEYPKASLFSVAVFDEVAGQGINAQFHLRDPLSVQVGSHGDGANIAFLIDPYSFEWPMSEEAISTETDATHHRPSTELWVTAAFDERFIDERGHSTSRVIGVSSSQLIRFS